MKIKAHLLTQCAGYLSNRIEQYDIHSIMDWIYVNYLKSARFEFHIKLRTKANYVGYLRCIFRIRTRFECWHTENERAGWEGDGEGTNALNLWKSEIKTLFIHKVFIIYKTWNLHIGLYTLDIHIFKIFFPTGMPLRMWAVVSSKNVCEITAIKHFELSWAEPTIKWELFYDGFAKCGHSHGGV